LNLHGSFEKLLLYIELRPQKKIKTLPLSRDGRFQNSIARVDLQKDSEIPKLHSQSRPPKRLRREIPKLQTRVDLQRLRREIPKLHSQSRSPKRLRQRFRNSKPESISKDSDGRFRNSKPEPISKDTDGRFRNSKPESISKDSDGRFRNSKPESISKKTTAHFRQPRMSSHTTTRERLNSNPGYQGVCTPVSHL
jgi:hypothetical protein